MRQLRVDLSRNERGQVLEIPHGFELAGDHAILTRDNGRLVLEPVTRDVLVALLDRLEPLDEDWPEIADPPPEPVSI